MAYPESFEIRGLSSRDTWDHENAYHWFSEPRRIQKLLGHWELYKQIVGLPGDIVECGVYKAASLIRWATFRDALEAPQARRIVAFDAFGAFPRDDVSRVDDISFINEFSTSGDGLSELEVKRILDRKGLGTNVELLGGDVRQTVPEFLSKHGSMRIAFLHIDLDVYEPTAFVLGELWSRIVPGGLLVLDDYNAVEGATRAIEEWMSLHPTLRLQKLPFAHHPAFVIKP
jgi:hypothetical protein